MGKRPDLGVMPLTKAAAAATVPFSAPAVPPSAPVPSSVVSPKSLTIKVDGPTYAALRHYCHAQEMERGTRVTHQEIVVTAIHRLLGLGD